MFYNKFKRLGEYFTRIKFGKIREVNTYQSNNLNIIPSTMIKRGHYQSKASLTSEKPEIIRVLGPNKSRENYYKLQGGTEKSEFEIENDYVYIDTVALEETAPKRNIFEFEPIESSSQKNTISIESTDTVNPYNTTISLLNENSDTQHIGFTGEFNKVLEIQINKILGNQNHIISLLANQHALDNNTKQSDDTLQISQETNPDILDVIKKIHINSTHTPPNIILPVNIPLDYDLSKVQALVDLFEFPIKDVIKTIIIKTLSNPNTMNILIDNIVYSIGKQITTNTSYNTPDNENHTSILNPLSDTVVEAQHNKPQRTKHANNPISINDNISSIDDFLNQFK